MPFMSNLPYLRLEQNEEINRYCRANPNSTAKHQLLMGHQKEEERMDLEHWSGSLCLFLVGKLGCFGQLKVTAVGCWDRLEFAAEYRGYWSFVHWDLAGSGLHSDRLEWMDCKVLIEYDCFAGLYVLLFGWFRHSLDFDYCFMNFHYWKLYSMLNLNYLMNRQRNCWKNCWHYCYFYQQCQQYSCLMQSW